MRTVDAEAAYTFLLGLPRFALSGSEAYKPGLERIRELLKRVEDPHTRYPSIHVAGTNGKGSAASMVSAVLSAAGLRVGLHTSPHIHGLEERMRIDGNAAPQEWIGKKVSSLRDHIEEVGASFFEATVLLSFLYFAEQAVDVAVVEVGLGGRYDATNVLVPEVAAITEISLEHTDILGPTLEGIAREKAGIMKSGVPTMTIAEEPALAELINCATATGSTLEDVRESCRVMDFVSELTRSQFSIHTRDHIYSEVTLPLPGQHQLWNAALAVRSVEAYADRMELTITAEHVLRGLHHVREYTGLTGRLQTISEVPLIIVDNAHNPQSIGATLLHLSRFVTGRLHVGIGLMKDKDVHRIADLLAGSRASVSVVPVAAGRAIDAKVLASQLKHRGVEVDISNGASHVVETFRASADAQDVLLLTGSHHVVAEALGIRARTN